MTEPVLPPLSPITIKERVSLAFIEKGHLDVLDGAFVVVDATGVRTHIPVGGIPGFDITICDIKLWSRRPKKTSSGFYTGKEKRAGYLSATRLKRRNISPEEI